MSKKERFKDKVVIVTGASSGIGKATALAFAQECAKTVLVSRSREKLESVADEIRGFNENVLVLPTDVSSKDEVDMMVEKVISKFGRIDILFNNAGNSYVGPIGNENFVKDTKEMLDVDFMGTVYTTRAVLPLLKKQGSGHIMNMSSVVGRKAFPHFGGYSSAMHAITAFTDSMRQELRGSGIGVSTIHPALTQTPLLERVKPEEMPPPFKGITPITVESVAKAVLDGVYYNRARVVVPFQPKLLLLADAISPSLGDLVVRLLAKKAFSRVLGMYRGNLYQHGKAY